MDFDFSKPAPQTKTHEEAQRLIRALWEICAGLQGEKEELSKQVAAQKEKLNTNSSNSSMPPSSDLIPQPKKKKRRFSRGKSNLKQGAQPGHKGKSRELLPPEKVDDTVICLPKSNCGCGSPIEVRLDSFKRHQVFELPPIKPIVTEYQKVFGICSGCGQHHFGALPAGVPTGILGKRAIATVGILSGEYRLSKRLIAGLLNDIYNLPVSTGTISNTEKLVSEALKKPVEEAHEYVKAQPVKHADETSHKQKGNKMWMWVCIAALVAIFMTRPKRDTRAAKDLLGETFVGILVSDRYSAYNWIDITRRQFCWAHLLRDFTKISERSGKAGQIGEQLLAYSHRMFRLWWMTRDGPLNRIQFVKSMEPVREGIEKLLEQGGVCKDVKTQNTCKKLLKQKAGLWTFVEVEGVEPTNNTAEQTIRAYVIWRKISFGTQSERGNRFVERMLTTTASCRLQKRNSLDFVTSAVEAHLKNEPAPSLLPVTEKSPALDIAA